MVCPCRTQYIASGFIEWLDIPFCINNGWGIKLPIDLLSEKGIMIELGETCLDEGYQLDPKRIILAEEGKLPKTFCGKSVASVPNPNPEEPCGAGYKVRSTESCYGHVRISSKIMRNVFGYPKGRRVSVKICVDPRQKIIVLLLKEDC